MLRVADLQRSVDFYTRVIGMSLLRTTERPEQKYSLAFVGFGRGNADGSAELELTYNHGVDRYDLGSAYGHMAFGVDDIVATCERIRQAGGTITREPGPVKGGATVIASVSSAEKGALALSLGAVPAAWVAWPSVPVALAVAALSLAVELCLLAQPDIIPATTRLAKNTFTTFISDSSLV